MCATPIGSKRLTRISRNMEVVTTAGIVLIAVLTVLAFIIPDWTRNLLLAKLGQASATLPITPGARVIAAAIVAIPVGVMIYGLLAVRALFRGFVRGDIFTQHAARRLQTFAATVAAQAPLGPITAIGLSVALTLANPPDQRIFALAFSTTDYFALIVGGVLFAAATVMREAARIAEENAGFV